MITLSNTPGSYNTDPLTQNPPPDTVGECLDFGLTPDNADGIGTAGVKAQVVFSVPNPPSVVANGTEFTVWGKTFTVDDTQPFTSTSFKVTTNMLETALNMRDMFGANVFFANAVNILVDVNVPTTVTLQWKECRAQDNFTGLNMDFTNMSGTGITMVPTNGTTPVYVDGYIIGVQLMKYDPDQVNANSFGYIPITKLEGVTPKRGCSAISAVEIDYRRDIGRTLYTPMPDLTTTAEIPFNTPTIMGTFKLFYGWTYRDGNCQPQSGTFVQSAGSINVLNAAFELEEPYKMRRYWGDHPAGFPPGQFVQDFLTNQPKTMRVCQNSFLWVWLLNGFTISNPTTYKLRLTVAIYKKGYTGGVFEFLTYDKIVGGIQWYVPNWNVSVQRIISEGTLTIDELEKYSIQVTGYDAANEVLYNASEYLTYLVDETCCGSMTDIYFLTPPGGIGTLVVDVLEREITQTGKEICLDIPCNTGDSERAKYGGRIMGNLRAYEEITVRARENWTEEHLAYFRAFKASPERWVRVKSGDGWLAKRFLVTPGSVRIYKDGEKLELVASGYTDDIPLQTPKNLS